MNERIKELAQEAYDYALIYDNSMYGEVYDKKFAELIVKECLLQIGHAIPDTNCSAADAYKTAKFAAMSRVKEHFGVQE